MKKTLKIMMMLALVCIISACSNTNSNTTSDNKTEGKQRNASIVGKWKGVRATEDGEFDEQWTKLLQYYTCEFKEDGTVVWWIDDIEDEFPDYYTLEGNNLTFKDDNTKYTVTITKKKLVRESIRGGHTLAEEFERVK